MRQFIIALLALACAALPATARTEKVMMVQESANGDRRAELQVQSEEGSIVAGCRTSSKSTDYEAYWMKSEKNGSRICVEKSKRDEVTQGHYLQKRADGSSLAASFESSEGTPDQVHFLLKGPSGEETQVARENKAVWLQRLSHMDQEMNIFIRDIQSNLRGGSEIR